MQSKASPELLGLDTEAAEQVFQIANRWQANLSNSHPVHFELQLLLYADEHNGRNECYKAWETYQAKQAAAANSKREKAKVPWDSCSSFVACSVFSSGTRYVYIHSLSV